MFKAQTLIIIGIAMFVTGFATFVWFMVVVCGDYNVPLLIDPVLKQTDFGSALTKTGGSLPFFTLLLAVWGIFITLIGVFRYNKSNVVLN